MARPEPSSTVRGSERVQVRTRRLVQLAALVLAVELAAVGFSFCDAMDPPAGRPYPPAPTDWICDEEDPPPAAAAGAKRILARFNRACPEIQRKLLLERRHRQQLAGVGGDLFHQRQSRQAAYCRIFCRALRMTGDWGGCKCGGLDLFVKFKGMSRAGT